jgi:hypothetical protein
MAILFGRQLVESKLRKALRVLGGGTRRQSKRHGNERNRQQVFHRFLPGSKFFNQAL